MRRPILHLYAFDADYIKPITIFVLSGNIEDARTDAYSAALPLFGRIMRLAPTGKQVASLPTEAEPIGSALTTTATGEPQPWAWYTLRQ